MTSHRQSPRCERYELSEVQARTYGGGMQASFVLQRAGGEQAAESADPHHVIKLLALIAHDEQVTSESPTRVVEALQNHGHVLGDEAVETLRDWLEETLRS